MSFNYSHPKAMELVRAIRAESGRDFLRLLLALLDERVTPAKTRDALEQEIGEDALVCLLNARSELRAALDSAPPSLSPTHPQEKQESR